MARPREYIYPVTAQQVLARAAMRGACNNSCRCCLAHAENKAKQLNLAASRCRTPARQRISLDVVLLENIPRVRPL